MTLVLRCPLCGGKFHLFYWLTVMYGTWGLQLNIGQETLGGLLAHWSAQRRAKSVAPTTANGDVSPSLSSGAAEHGSNRRTAADDSKHEPNVQQPRVLPNFQFSTQSPPFHHH